MSRVLWVVYERVPHPDAVSYPLTEAEAEFVLELLGRPDSKRAHLAEQLRNSLRRQLGRPVFDRQRVPCRRASGLYVLVSWRMAKWLSHALLANDGPRERTLNRIRHWLAESDGAADAVLING